MNSGQLKEWYKMLKQHGCAISGEKYPGLSEIHHVKGRKYKINKVLVGEIYAFALHKIYHNEMYCGEYERNTGIQVPNVTRNKSEFEAMFGSQKAIFKDVCEKIMLEHSLPFDVHLIELILNE